MTAPVPNCPQPETLIRERAWTDGQRLARLRELAERWRSDGDILVRECAAELLSILDAEGDGNAVGCLTISRFRGSDAMVNHDFDYYGDLPDGSYSLYTHPERSGGVSDADVRECADIHFKSLTGDAIDRSPGDQDVDLMQAELDQAMRAALTHFAKGERHE